jgi:uncharacterized protein (DUF58 family)
MNTTELLEKIHRIEITTKGLTKQFFNGHYHSSFKGRGMTFDEVREYQIGDEVRTIDWNVTARFNGPFVKVFEEERELVVMLFVDMSASMYCGSGNKTKKELALELMAVLGFSAIANDDKVGALFVSDGVEKFIPANKGRKHLLYILRSFIDFEPVHKQTNLNKGFEFFRNCMKKRTICFVISDLLDTHAMEDGLSLVHRKHDVIALRITDPSEEFLPDLGLVKLYNSETGVSNWVNTSSHEVQKKFSESKRKEKEQTSSMLKKLGVSNVLLSTTEDYIPKLVQLFQRKRR